MEHSLNMPLVEAMINYKEQNVYPLHTPGHKGGRGMVQELQGFWGDSLAMEVSLMSELDDIHEPETYIKAGQQLAAELYGSDRCFWAVNGTSQAIHAMLMTALKPGEKLLLPRNAHRSVAGGLILGGIEAVYLEPDFDCSWGLQQQITCEQVMEALDKYEDVKALLITSPNYYGVAAPVAKLAELCHSKGVLLLVDEAHGPHLGFSRLLPPSALQCGADACAQSTHKLVGAMTQCSMLHVQGKRLDLQRAADIMSVLTTTSPNYFLMASLDAARAQLQANGVQMVERAVKAAQKLRRLCRELGLRVLETDDCHGCALDITKVTVNVSDWGYDGVYVGDKLRQAGIAVELVDACNVLFLVTYADDNEDYEKALLQIGKVLRQLKQEKTAAGKALAVPRLPVVQSGCSLRKVFNSPKESCSLETAAGRICGEQVSFYPPGIPVLLPGEIITAETVEYCKEMKALGLPVSGPADTSLQTLRVLMR